MGQFLLIEVNDKPLLLIERYHQVNHIQTGYDFGQFVNQALYDFHHLLIGQE